MHSMHVLLPRSTFNPAGGAKCHVRLFQFGKNVRKKAEASQPASSATMMDAIP